MFLLSNDRKTTVLGLGIANAVGDREGKSQ